MSHVCYFWRSVYLLRVQGRLGHCIFFDTMIFCVLKSIFSGYNFQFRPHTYNIQKNKGIELRTISFFWIVLHAYYEQIKACLRAQVIQTCAAVQGRHHDEDTLKRPSVASCCAGCCRCCPLFECIMHWVPPYRNPLTVRRAIACPDRENGLKIGS